MFQDLRYGMRMLLKSPGFTLIAVITLALGIGAVAAIFSVVDAVLWRPLPAHRPERLVALYTSAGDGVGYRSLSYTDYSYYRDNQKSFDGLAAYVRVPLNWRDGDRVERIGSELVSGNFFGVLGLQAAAGRLFTVEDDRVDSSMLLDWGKQPDVWLPMMMQPQALPRAGNIDLLGDRDARWLMAIGRLKDGVNFAQAEAEIKTLAARIAAAWPRHNAGRKGILLPASQARFWPEYRREITRFLTMLGVLAALVLLVACFNVGNLLLARAAGRRKEIGVRLALGAGRWRLARQWLTESLLLAMVGAGAGLLVAAWLMNALTAFQLPFKIPLAIELRLDPRALVFTLLAAMATSLIFGLAPAWRAARLDLVGSMTLQARTTGEPLGMASAVRAAARETDPQVFINQISTINGQIDLALSQPRMAATFSGLLALLALLLAAMGLSGMIAYSVSRRTREIGIRMALGARPRDVLKLVVSQGMTLALVGVAFGLIASAALSRLLRSLLFGVSAHDPLTLVVISLSLIVVALLACYIPARRAMKVDPLVALRRE